MKKLIIIGAGGMGREIYYHAKESIGFEKDFIIKGFLDDNPYSLNGYSNFPKILSSIYSYEICKDDVFVCSIGNVFAKKKTIENIISRGGTFISLVHTSARVEKDTKIGTGVIIMRRAEIGSYAEVGNFSLIQAEAVIGHDSIVKDYCRIDCKVVCVGGVIIEELSTVHTSAVVSHGVTVGKNAVIGALSFVIRNVKDGCTVVGNPATILK